MEALNSLSKLFAIVAFRKVVDTKVSWLFFGKENIARRYWSVERSDQSRFMEFE